MSDPTDPSKDPAGALLREIQNSPSQKLMSELANSPSAQLAREMANSPAAKLVQEYAASPAAKLARELAESPVARLSREPSHSPAAALLRDLESPAAKLAPGIRLHSSAEQTAMASTAKMLTGITIDPGVANMLAGQWRPLRY
jgi:hypothetical protein